MKKTLSDIPLSDLGHPGYKPQHTPTPGYEGLSGILVDGVAESLRCTGWHENAIADIVRAVNSHEELVGMLKVYRNELLAKATTTGEKGYLNMYQLVDKTIAKADGK